VDTVHYTAELVPEGYPLHGLGIGKPENLVKAVEAGYGIFDCVLPTRDARHRRLYVFDPGVEAAAADPRRLLSGSFYHHLYIGDKRFLRDAEPIDPGCDCLCCGRYSRAYLHHLFRVGDPLAFRLASLHNLRLYARLVEMLRRTGRQKRKEAARSPGDSAQ
jgi:queuine tRNA-ribosyltransferase